MSRMTGKVCIVTGGASGIGRSTADLLAEEGAIVIAADRAPGPIEPFESDAVSFVQMDVSNEDAWTELVAGALHDHQHIDVLVNAAAIAGTGAQIHDESLAAWNELMTINQTGPFLGMRAVLPAMRAAGSGSIVNFSSIWGITAVPSAASYHASKGAIRAMSKQAAVSYASDGIRVNSIHPGITWTPPVASQPDEVKEMMIQSTPMGRVAQPIELARGVLFLASDESSYMTGAELVIDGGFTAM